MYVKPVGHSVALKPNFQTVNSSIVRGQWTLFGIYLGLFKILSECLWFSYFDFLIVTISVASMVLT